MNKYCFCVRVLKGEREWHVARLYGTKEQMEEALNKDGVTFSDWEKCPPFEEFTSHINGKTYRSTSLNEVLRVKVQYHGFNLSGVKNDMDKVLNAIKESTGMQMDYDIFNHNFTWALERMHENDLITADVLVYAGESAYGGWYLDMTKEKQDNLIKEIIHTIKY